MLQIRQLGIDRVVRLLFPAHFKGDEDAGALLEGIPVQPEAELIPIIPFGRRVHCVEIRHLSLRPLRSGF